MNTYIIIYVLFYNILNNIAPYHNWYKWNTKSLFILGFFLRDKSLNCEPESGLRPFMKSDPVSVVCETLLVLKKLDISFILILYSTIS